MKSLWFGTLCAGVGLAVLIAGTAEGCAAWLGSMWRGPVYAGGAAGLVLGLAGLPFAYKLSQLKTSDPTSAFWTWWGGGVLVRLVLLLPLALGLAALFKETSTAALLAMGATYFISMITESAWVAVVCSQQNSKKS